MPKHNTIIAAIVLVASFLLSCGTVRAAVPATKFPRLANYYLNPTLTPAIADQLARWDFLVLDMEAGYTTPELIRRIRTKNPDIVILAYVTSQEIATRRADIADHNNPYYRLYASIPDGWWLKDHSGNRTVFFPGTVMLNVTNNAQLSGGERWNTFLPKFLHENVMSTGLWDGIYYDNTWKDIAWLNKGDLDSDNNGTTDDAATLDAAWRDGMNTLLATSRALEGNAAILLGNGSGQYFSYLNGRLMEEYPNPEDGSWTNATQLYLDILKNAQRPSYVILNGKSSTQQADDFQSMRFTLTSALLGDGLASFDAGIALDHVQLWWYDTYSVYLGKPLGAAQDILHDNGTTLRASVWRRDFRDGIVLVNSTSKSQTIDLIDGYEPVASTLAASTRPNVIVSNVTLAPLDGIILLKRKFMVEQGGYYNGAFTRTFFTNGTTNRQGFFTYDPDLRGGTNVVKQDIDHDGKIEVVYSEAGTVTVLNHQGTLVGRFQPYGKQYRGSVNLAIGDINGDGIDEIVTGTGRGGGPQVKIFSKRGAALSGGFFAYAKGTRGGVSVAVADLDGDGKAEIVTGAGKGLGPQVRVFDAKGAMRWQFFAYVKTLRSGVNVAAGDLDGDGKAEIVTGPGQGASPQVRIFGRSGRELSPPFFAFEQGFRGGISVSVVDTNLDHRNEILVSTPTIY